jgi:glutamate 5-kinase
VEDGAGERLAVGICNYGAEEVARILGQRSDRIEELLGYRYGDEVIHRDNLAIL